MIDWILSQSQFAFEWDAGNATKNQKKHGVTCEEAESVFDHPEAIRALGVQVTPKVNEPRYGILGLTRNLKPVFVCFTIRGTGIRVIHIRAMNKKEKKFYADLCQK
ncbi:MAG: BrnT family toxin [Bdellovibrionia bacterium]